MKLDLNDLNLGVAGAFFKDVWHDLVNKRLVPVAAALVIALVAVPLVLARGGSDAPPPAPTTAATPAPETDAEVADVRLAESRPSGQGLDAAARDPFEQKRERKPAAEKPASSEPSAGTQSPAAGDSDSDETAGSDELDTSYEIVIDFGLAGEAKRERTVAAMTPLPSADDAYIVYLGARDGGKTAVFLVSTDVRATGDGVCEPSEDACQRVEVKVGDTQLFDVTDTATGTALGSYELELTQIRR